jgi:negative regulator of flagellin synthesis FlgM
MAVMTSKIEGLLPTGRPSSPTSVTPARPAGAAGVAAKTGAVAPDSSSVRVSGEAAGLASLERQLSEAPAMDLAKVAAVRAALENGTYKIDPRAIAARLSQIERELGV